MPITPSATLGAAIAVQVGGPLALLLSFLSHFLLDYIPHWQGHLFPDKPTFKTWIIVALDLAFALLFVNYIAHRHPSYGGFILLNAFLANAADLDVIAGIHPQVMENPLFRRYYDWHRRIQRGTSRVWGLIPPLVVVIISIFLSV